MLRINLLPPYVTQRRLTKRLIPVFALLLLVSVALPLLLFANMKTHLNDITQQAEADEQAKSANDALDALAASTKAQVQPILDKVNFVEAIHKYNRDQVTTIVAVANQSPKKSFIYSGMAPGAGYSTMTINAYSPSVEEAGRYLQAMYQQPAFTSVAVDNIPGYPNNVQHRWYLGKIRPENMVFADGASASGGGAAGGSGYPGGGGYPGGAGGGTAAAAPGGSNALNLASNGPGNVPPGVGPPPPELTGGLATAGGGGGYPGGGGGGYPGGGGGVQAGGGGYSPNFLRIALAGVSPFATPEVIARILASKMRQVHMVTIPKGFNVTVTAGINTPYAPLTAPAPPGSAPAGGAAGGFPSGGGYPGGGGSGYPGGGSNYPGASGYPGGRASG